MLPGWVLLLGACRFVGDYIDQSTQQLIHIYPNNISSLCREIPSPWNQYYSYRVSNDRIHMAGAVGKLENQTLYWEGSFESKWERIANENDYT